MAATLPPATNRRHWGGSEALVGRVALALGVRGWRASELMWGARSAAAIAATIIRTLKTAQADEALVHFLQPIDLALLAATPEPFSPALIIAEQEADAAEDVAEMAMLATATPATKRAYLRRLEAAIGAAQRLRASLLVELDRA